MEKKRVVQVLVPCIILVAVVGIFLIKNPSFISQKLETQNSASDSGEKEEHQNQSVQDENNTVSDTDHVQGENADFSLAVTETVDFEEMSSYGLPMIVDYGSDSCIPCKEMAPVLEKMNQEMEGKAFIKFVDVWKYTDAANNVPVQVIPTQVLVNADGTPFVPSEGLAAQIQFTLYTSKETGEHVFTVHQGGMTEEQMRLILEEMAVAE